MHDGSALLTQRRSYFDQFYPAMKMSPPSGSSVSPPAPLLRRRSSLVRNLCRETRFEALPMNFSRPLFIPSLAEHRLDGCKSVQLASVSFAMQAFVGQIICPNSRTGTPSAPSSPVTSPSLTASSKASAPPLSCVHRNQSINSEEAPHRRVFVRYTVNSWQSYVDTGMPPLLHSAIA